MDDNERHAIAEQLQQATPEVLAEIVREAESFLGEQLKSGLAADQRAMTLAVILAAVIAALVGGTASLIAAKIEIGPHIYSLAPMVLLLSLALIFAVQAARPTSFFYVGSNPRHWLADIREKRPLHRSMAEQAAFYSQNISQNKACLDDGHFWLRRALFTAMLATLSFVCGEFVIGMSWIAKNGLPALA
jgi:hypothetical protein